MKRRILNSQNKPVTAAADSTASTEAFEESMENLSDNFDYVMDGLDKLAREGKEGQNQAMQLALELDSYVEAITKKIAEAVAQ